jgi:hypothetical protein
MLISGMCAGSSRIAGVGGGGSIDAIGSDDEDEAIAA